MTTTRVLAVRCVLLSAPVLATACSSTVAPMPSAAPSTTTTSVSAAPDTGQPRADEAVALVPVYWETVDQLYTDPSLSIDGLYDVAVDPEATSEAATLQAFRTSGYTQTGQSLVVSTTTSSVDLDTTGEAGGLPTVQVTACVDVTQVGATDVNGASVVAPDQAPYLVADMTIVNIAYPDPSAWRVSSAPNTQAQACPG